VAGNRSIIESYQQLEKKAVNAAKKWCDEQGYEVFRINFKGFNLDENTFIFIRLFGSMHLQSQAHSVSMDLLKEKERIGGIVPHYDI